MMDGWLDEVWRKGVVSLSYSSRSISENVCDVFAGRGRGSICRMDFIG